MFLVSCEEQRHEPEQTVTSEREETDALRRDLTPFRQALAEESTSYTTGGQLPVVLQPPVCGNGGVSGAFGEYLSDRLHTALAHEILSFLPPNDPAATQSSSSGVATTATACISAVYRQEQAGVRITLSARLLNDNSNLVPTMDVLLRETDIPPLYDRASRCRVIPHGAILCVSGAGASALRSSIEQALNRNGIPVLSPPPGLCACLVDTLFRLGTVPARLVSTPVASALIVAQAHAQVVDSHLFIADAGGRIMVATIGETNTRVREFPLTSVRTGFCGSGPMAIGQAATMLMNANNATFAEVAREAR